MTSGEHCGLCGLSCPVAAPDPRDAEIAALRARLQEIEDKKDHAEYYMAAIAHNLKELRWVLK